jgi:hypothetical protein
MKLNQRKQTQQDDLTRQKKYLMVKSKIPKAAVDGTANKDLSLI